MELNAEQIKKALECCYSNRDCDGCPNSALVDCRRKLERDAVALIRELTEENKAWQMQLISKEEKADKAYYDLACEVEDLRAENKRLHASYTELARKCASLNEENDRLTTERYRHIEEHEAEVYAVKADTLRKLKKILIENYVISKVPYIDGEEPIVTYQLTNWDLRTVEKKVLEGE